MNTFFKKLMGFTLLFIVLNIFLNYIYELPAKKAIKNKIHKNDLKWTDIHNNTNTYNLILIGASRAYTAFNPNILDANLNLNSYNMGTSAQDIAESYYTLKEILEYQKPKFVVLDLFFKSSDTEHDFYQIYSNASFFKSANTKFNLIQDGYGVEGFVNYCIPLVKFKNYIKNDFNKLLSRGNNTKHEDHWIKGYSYDTVTVSKTEISKFKPISNFNNTSFNQQRFNKFFNKIKDLTDAHNIKLLCVRTPYPPSRLAIDNIDEEGDFFKTFLKHKGIPFYDLNLYKPEAYKYYDSDFSDYHHPNYRGAEKASKQLIEIIKE